MKKFVAVLLFALAFVSVAAHAVSLADSQSTSGSQSGAINSGVNNTFYSPDAVDYKGGYSVKTNPTVAPSAGYGSFAQTNCMVSGSAGISLVGFGATGQTPIDGIHCDFRLDQQNLNAGAMTIHNFVASAPMIDDDLKKKLDEKAAKMLDTASDMSCLSSDRQRAVMEIKGLCADVANVATLDHRFNQPRSTQIDYSGK
jgi:hypothetical protein